MSELEIRVRTRLRKRTDVDELILPDHQCPAWTNPNSACLDRGDRPRAYYCRVYKNQVTIEVDTETLQTMQKENAEDACIDVEISDDEVMEEEEEEEELDTFQGFDSSPMSVSSRTDSPSNATSSPINIPGHFGPDGPRTRRTSSGSTPPTQCLSYLGRMFPGAHCDSSPLSSGYGSAPRYSASTQTPSTPVFCETLIRLRILGLSGNQSDERQQPMTRRQRIQMQAERRARGRVYSENNSDDLRGDGEEEDGEHSGGAVGMPLPDLVAFRDRSNSAPTSLMRPEIRVGRQLRRISDEFHLSYHDQQSLRARQQQTILQRLLNTLRGNHHGHREGSAV